MEKLLFVGLDGKSEETQAGTEHCPKLDPIPESVYNPGSIFGSRTIRLMGQPVRIEHPAQWAHWAVVLMDHNKASDPTIFNTQDRIGRQDSAYQHANSGIFLFFYKKKTFSAVLSGPGLLEVGGLDRAQSGPTRPSLDYHATPPSSLKGLHPEENEKNSTVINMCTDS